MHLWAFGRLTMTKFFGPWDIEKCNYNGKVFRDFGSILGLCSAASFFQKKLYGTWIHPRSKFPYHLDHFLVKQSNVKCVSDAGRFGVHPVACISKSLCASGSEPEAES